MKRRSSFAVDIGLISFCAVMTGIGYASGFRGFAAAMLFGSFAAYLVVFDDDSARRHGSLARMLVGAICGVSIGIICSAAYAIWIIAAGLGAALGYFGAKWARYV